MTNTERMAKILAWYAKAFKGKKHTLTLLLNGNIRVIGRLEAESSITETDKIGMAEFISCFSVSNAIVKDKDGTAHHYDMLAIIPDSIIGIGITE